MSQSTQRVSLETAYILHHRPYRDTSLLIEAFTPSYGRVGLVAKGVRKQKGRWQALMQPFVPLLLSWSGRGELATVTDAEMGGSAHQLKGQIFLSGFYVNELLTRLLHRYDPHPVLFDVYSRVLASLAAASVTIDQKNELQQQLRFFEKILLQEIGYGLVLDCEVQQGEAIEPSAMYHYVLGQGPVLVDESADDAVMIDGIVIRGSSLLALDREHFETAEQLRDAKRLMRVVLDQYLGDRPLHSRQLLVEMQKAGMGKAMQVPKDTELNS